MLTRSHHSPLRPYFIPCEPGHRPPPLPPLQETHSIPSIPEGNAGQTVSARATSLPLRTETRDKYIPPLVAVAREKVGTCEACLRLCRFGRNHCPVIEGRGKYLKSWSWIMCGLRNHGGPVPG